MKPNYLLLLIVQVFFYASMDSQTCETIVSACDPATGTSSTTTFAGVDMNDGVVQPDPDPTDYIGPSVIVSGAGCDDAGNFFDVKITAEQLTTSLSPSIGWGSPLTFGTGEARFSGDNYREYEITVEFFEAGTTTPKVISVLQEIGDIDGVCDLNRDGVPDISDCSGPIAVGSTYGESITASGYDYVIVNNPTLLYETTPGTFASAGNDNTPFSAISGVPADQTTISGVLAWKDVSTITYKYYAGTFKRHLIDFTGVASFTSECLILPVTFDHFSAEKQGNNVQLNWATGSESNGKQFDIEYSNDGLHFKTLTTINSKGDTEFGNSYSYVHQDASELNSPSLYYRVKFVEYGGAVAYTGIKQVILSDNNGNATIGYNAISKEIVINGEKLDQVEVFDINGRVLLSQKLNSNSEVNTVDAKELASGIYIVKSNSVTSKIVIR